MMNKAVKISKITLFKFLACAAVIGLGLNILSCAPGESPFVAVGDSTVEGVQSADANLRTQPNCFPNLIAKQIGFNLPLPLILSSPLGVVGQTQFRTRLHPDLPAANLAVSGADTEDILTDSASDIDDGEIGLVLSPNFGMTQIEIAEANPAPFVIVWVGNNDVLSAVTDFNELNPTQIEEAMTDPELFRRDFSEVARRLNDREKKVFYGNVVDVTKIGFLVDSADLIRFLSDDFGLEAGEFTSIVVMFLLKLGLVDSSILEDGNFILDADEVGQIQARITELNAIIDDVVKDIGPDSAIVVNINALFEDLVTDPPQFGSVTITPRFLEGLFSLDGVHPSNIGQALIANAFIEANNMNFPFKVDLISEDELDQIALNDPFIDKDGDGIVRGRPGAGLLETIAPLLGISGDTDEIIIAAHQELMDGRRFVEEYLSLKRFDPELADQWHINESIKMFKDILSINEK